MVISNLKFFIGGGGYSGVNFVHLKSEVFHFWGGVYSGVNFGHLKSEVFHLGGNSRVNFGHLKSEVFHWGRGGLSGLKFQKGTFWRIWTQILLFEECVHKPACTSQIVSHILRMWRLTIRLILINIEEQ